MSLNRMVGGVGLALVGVAIAYSGLGLAGVLAEQNLDLGHVFRHIAPTPFGYAGVGIGVLVALIGVALILTSPEDEDAEEYFMDEELDDDHSDMEVEEN